MFYLRLCFSNVHRPLCFLVLEASFGHGLAAAAAFQISLFGAENETRTRDPDLGKVVLYQLSYFRIAFLVLRVGLEPTRPCGQGILSPSCLPFHHQSVSL